MGPLASRSVLVAVPAGASRQTVAEALERGGYRPFVVGSAEEVTSALERFPHPVAVVHVDLPGEARALIRRIADKTTDVRVIVVAPDASVSEAVEHIKLGASDFLVEPLDLAGVSRSVEKALVEASLLDAAPAAAVTSRILLGESASMKTVRATTERVARGNATVLLRGESGTGKELVARALHEGSPRALGPFVKLNCAALPDALLESELFGHERGAFTGAAARKLGRVELAAGGTLFLDEIGDITPAMQVKLLRLLQERQLERLGGVETISVDVRFVAATHRPLEAMVERGEFREDLFYRLNVVPLWLPPLRTRREDIVPLARHFCQTLGAAHGRPHAAFEEGALRALRRERWPGNVRQLQNFVERMVVLASGDSISEDDVNRELAPAVDFTTQAPSMRSEHALTGALESARDQAERDAVRQALDRAGGNRTQAARLLGISRRTLYNKMDELGLS